MHVWPVAQLAAELHTQVPEQVCDEGHIMLLLQSPRPEGVVPALLAMQIRLLAHARPQPPQLDSSAARFLQASAFDWVLQQTDASLSIDTEPPGATIFLDGKELGPAPISAHEIAVGSHTLRAVADEHEPDERTVEIHRDGERTNLLLTLKPLAPRVAEPEPGAAKTPAAKVAKGKLTLSTTQWSQVFQGNRKLGETPLVDLALPAGKHALRLKNHERGLSKTIVVEIKPGRTTLLREKL